MTHPLESRVGQNCPISAIKSEAEAFLRKMHSEGLSSSSRDFEQRLETVLAEIEENSVVWYGKMQAVIVNWKEQRRRAGVAADICKPKRS
jgi:hypothetical protein